MNLQELKNTKCSEAMELLIKTGDRIAVYCIEYATGSGEAEVRGFSIMTFKNYSLFKQVIRDRFPGQIVMTVNCEGLLNNYVVPVKEGECKKAFIEQPEKANTYRILTCSVDLVVSVESCMDKDEADAIAEGDMRGILKAIGDMLEFYHYPAVIARYDFEFSEYE